jgi:hypothetical protein
MSSSPFFTEDRKNKYFWGCLRLAFVAALAFTFESWGRIATAIATSTNINDGSFPLSDELLVPCQRYLTSNRWMLHVYLGVMGATVNVNYFPTFVNLVLLMIAGLFIVRDLYIFSDVAIVVYLAKTMGGDYFAGKLDTIEWKLVLLYTFLFVTPLAVLCTNAPTVSAQLQSLVSTYGRIFLVMFGVQFFCEYGDAHLEYLTFFRYRYSFELATIAMLALIPTMTAAELDVVRFDLVICLFYRVGNYGVIKLREVMPAVLTAFKMSVFHALSLRLGVPFVQVKYRNFPSLRSLHCIPFIAFSAFSFPSTHSLPSIALPSLHSLHCIFQLFSTLHGFTS